MEVLEPEEEAKRRIVEAKVVEIHLTDDLIESIEENELKDTLSQISAASCGTESQRVTDWVQNGSVENSNKSQPIVADADPRACASVHSAPMSTSFLVNPDVVNISNATFDNQTRDSKPLFQQQSCATVIGLSIPAVLFGLANTAIAPPAFDFSLVNSIKFVENWSSNLMQAVTLHVRPTSQLMTTVTTVASQRLTAPIKTYSSLATQIILTSEPVVFVESGGTVFYCNSSCQTAPYSTGITTI